MQYKPLVYHLKFVALDGSVCKYGISGKGTEEKVFDGRSKILDSISGWYESNRTGVLEFDFHFA
jgi:hypothetical protein